MTDHTAIPTVFRMGKRLYLRPIERTDIGAITRWINDEEITQFLATSYPLNIDAEMRWFESIGKNQTDIVFGMTLVDGNELIGISGLHKINPIDRTAMTGSFIGKINLWKQGYGSEAKMVLLDFAFNTLNLRKICSNVLATNLRSKGHLEKCGYREEGRLKKQVYRNGDYVDLVQMAVFKEDFLLLWEAFSKS